MKNISYEEFKKMINNSFSNLGFFIWTLACVSLISKGSIWGLEGSVAIVITLLPIISILWGFILFAMKKLSKK